MKSSLFWLQQAKNALLIKKTPVIRDGDPRKLRARLYAQSRRIKWRYTFKRVGDGVEVRIKDKVGGKI